MNYLGLDIASETGWSILNEKKELIEFGSIQINSQMTLSQKLIFLGNELERIFVKFQPSHVSIEDLICGISGIKILSYLARLNGVAIYISSKYVNNNISLFNPPEWKKNSFEGLNGTSKKWDVQLEVVKYYKLKFNMSNEECLALLDTRQKNNNVICKKKEESLKIKESILEYQKMLNRKRNPIENLEINIVNTKIKDLKNQFENYKKELKIIEKQIDKEMNKLSLQITSRTGINQNIADSIAINFCGIRGL